MNSHSHSDLNLADLVRVKRVMKFLTTVVALAWALGFSNFAEAAVTGWLNWRGPLQNSVSLEKGLPQKIDGKVALWTAD